MNDADRHSTIVSGPSDHRAARFRWRLGPSRVLERDAPVLMAILNVTPDSFSDGGELPSPSAIVARARRCVQSGADLLDIGGESSRPGAAPVPAAEQINRVVPAVEAIRDAGIDTPITIDTTRAEVFRRAHAAGADAINDVSAGADDPDMLPLAGETGAGIVLMHRLRPPDQDRYSTDYPTGPEYPGGVVAAVRAFLEERLAEAARHGVDPESALVDPGIGFGKTPEQNAALLRRSDVFLTLGAGVLIGSSRKSFLTAFSSDRAPRDRDLESAASAMVALASGARCFRVHDVPTHRRALDTFDRLLGIDRSV